VLKLAGFISMEAPLLSWTPPSEARDPDAAHEEHAIQRGTAAMSPPPANPAELPGCDLPQAPVPEPSNKRGLVHQTLVNCTYSVCFWYLATYLVIATSIAITTLPHWDHAELEFLTSLLLFDYLRMPTGASIMRSVRQGGAGLFNTFKVGIVLIFIWGCLSFLIFQDEINANNPCETAFQCMFVAINAGLHGDFAGMHGNEFDDLADAFPREIQLEPKRQLQWLFVTFFFVVWEYILLGIAQGQIVDAFAAIRDEEDEKQDNLAMYCLVCSLDRPTLERVSGWNKHIEEDHHPLSYLYFSTYVNQLEELRVTKSLVEHRTGLLCYVCDQIKSGRSDYLPTHVCLEMQSEADESLPLINNRLAELQAQIQRLDPAAPLG